MLWMERVDSKIIRDFGQTRMERFVVESPLLRPLPVQHFEYRHPEPIIVHRDGRILFQTNRYSMPAAYRGKSLDGLLDLADGTLILKHEGVFVRRIKLAAPGIKATVDDSVDRKEHQKAWLDGLNLEEKIRKQVIEKRKKAEQETEVTDPAIFDRLFHEIAMEVAA